MNWMSCRGNEKDFDPKRKQYASVHRTNTAPGVSSFPDRGFSYPSDLRVALKAEETKYIYSAGHAAGEMNQSLLAWRIRVGRILCGSQVNRIQIDEIRDRGDKVIAIGTEGDKAVSTRTDNVRYIPEVNE